MQDPVLLLPPLGEGWDGGKRASIRRSAHRKPSCPHPNPPPEGEGEIQTQTQCGTSAGPDAAALRRGLLISNSSGIASTVMIIMIAKSSR
jgi:hypothetical protein